MKIAIVAGEASGDQLAAALMAALRQRRPDVEFVGLGGPAMQAQGLRSWFDYGRLSVMGLVEVLKHLPDLLRLRRDLLARILAQKPDVVIGVDAPDFNLGLEKRCKAAGLCTVHFVSPSVWAWREQRAARIAESADRVLCLFPMEPPIYARYGVDAVFVGHPMADAVPLEPERAAARATLGLDGDGRVLAILPGSRLSEIQRLLPVFLQAAARIRQGLPGIRFCIPAADARCRQAIDAQLSIAGVDDVQVLDGQARTAMIAADAVLLASGTAALEAMLCKRPMAVAYRISPLTYRIVTWLGLLKVERFSLPNALSGRDLVPELMQDDCTPERIADTLLPMLTRDTPDPALLAEYTRLHQLLRQDAAGRAADAVLERVGGARP
ncbi:MAG: lipid-A-disaccharide synthase [Arenimonas sp.]|nr:lipid-A-disaccharide synthase [Arenimonas sp.]